MLWKKVSINACRLITFLTPSQGITTWADWASMSIGRNGLIGFKWFFAAYEDSNQGRDLKTDDLFANVGFFADTAQLFFVEWTHRLNRLQF